MKGQLPLKDDELWVMSWFTFAERSVRELAKEHNLTQHPRVDARDSHDFPIAFLTAAEKAPIPLSSAKLQLLRVTCLDEQDRDPLKLEPLIRRASRETTGAAARGSSAASQVLYFDDVASDLPGAMTARIRYRATGSGYSATLRIFTSDDSDPVLVRTIDVPAEANAAADILATAVIDAVRTTRR